MTTKNTKRQIAKENALAFFDELVASLTMSKSKMGGYVWTPKERMLYNRVVKFLKEA
jgi:hypothetical protein